jgi:hypothetical protein
MLAPDQRHPCRSQAEIPLIDLSEFRRPPLIEVRLKANKGFAYFRDTAELRCSVADGSVSQFEKMRQLRLVELIGI